MINTTRGLVRFQAIILTVIGLVLGCGFARQSLLSKWEQEANYRVAIVDATMARFRSELLRGEAKDIRIGLQDLSQIIGTRQFRLVLRNGLAIEISPPFARQISGSAQSKELTCVVVPLTWLSFFGGTKCSVERSALFYDAGHRHYLAEVTWTVDQAVDGGGGGAFPRHHQGRLPCEGGELHPAPAAVAVHGKAKRIDCVTGDGTLPASGITKEAKNLLDVTAVQIPVADFRDGARLCGGGGEAVHHAATS